MPSQLDAERIADELRSAITGGERRPGDKLGNEDDLAEHYGVTRAAVRPAIRMLREEGLVESRRGQGTFVRPGAVVKLRYSPEQPRGGPWTTSVATAGRVGEVRGVGVEHVPASRQIASWLEIPQGEMVVARRRHITNGGGDPIQLYVSYIPLSVVDGTPLGGPAMVSGGVYRALEALGHAPVEVGEMLAARMPTRLEATTLQLGKRTPVIDLVRVTRDDSGRPVEALHIVAAADRNILVYDHLPVARGRY